MNLANQLSVLRILLVPVFVYLFINAKPDNSSHMIFFALIIFIIAAITDLLDGYLARNLEKVTKFGKLIDPIADKILVTAALLCLLDAKLISVWIVLLLIGRDISVQGLRMIALSQGEVIAASFSGKLKTVLQMFAIITALSIISFKLEAVPEGYLNFLNGFSVIDLLINNSAQIITFLMWAAVITSLYSGMDYFMRCKKLEIE